MDEQPRDFESSESSSDHKSKNLLETLTNLVYLTKLDASSETNVKLYMNLADDCVRQLVDNLYPRE